MKNKGFTLIELLAVILILGILMLIAIPSVSHYINNSRKQVYIDTVKEIIRGASILVNGGELELDDTKTTYYINVNRISLEGGNHKTPYGDLDDAYVVVTYDGEEYDYYFIGKDSEDVGISTLTSLEELDSDDLKTEIGNISTDTGLIGKNKIVVFSSDETNEVKDATYTIMEDGSPLIKYPEDKQREDLVRGDLIKIGNEEFYVINNGDDLTLFARYNLKVGDVTVNGSYVKTYSESDEGYGMQNKDYKCDLGGKYDGIMQYAQSYYWGYTYTTSPGPGHYKYSYNQYSNPYKHVEYYKNKLIEMGARVKEARLINEQERLNLENVIGPNGKSILLETSTWFGYSMSVEGEVASICNTGYTNIDYKSKHFGVSPVIVID